VTEVKARRKPTLPRFQARPELATQLATIHGSTQGYLRDLVEQVTSLPDSRDIQRSFMSACVLGFKPTPLWLVVALTRLAEEDIALTRDNALALASAWFTIGGDEDE
jgi:hypothetical protein